MANRVDTSMHSMQLPALHPALDSVRGEPQPKQLPPRDDPMLAVSQIRNGSIRKLPGIRAPLSVYRAPNGAGIGRRMDFGGHAADSEGPGRVRGTPNRASLQHKRDSSPPVPPLALIP